MADNSNNTAAPPEDVSDTANTGTPPDGEHSSPTSQQMSRSSSANRKKPVSLFLSLTSILRMKLTSFHSNRYLD